MPKKTFNGDGSYKWGMWCLLKRHLIRLIRSEMCNRVISLSKKHQIEYLWLTQNVFIFSHCAQHSTLVFFNRKKQTSEYSTLSHVRSLYISLFPSFYTEQIQFKLFTTCTRIRHASASPTFQYFARFAFTCIAFVYMMVSICCIALHCVNCWIC